MPVNEKHLISYCVKPLLEHVKKEILKVTYTRYDQEQYHLILEAGSHKYPVELPKSEVKKITENANIYLLPENGANGWTQHYFLLDGINVPCKLTDISVGIMQTEMEPFSFLLGQIQVIPIKDSPKYSVNITGLQAKRVNNQHKITTDWHCTDISLVHYYNIYITISGQQQQLVGQSISCMHVSSYSPKQEEQSCNVTVTVQPVMRNGWVVPISLCAFTQVI